MSNIWYEGGVLNFKSGASLKFKYNIAQIIELENVVVVRLDVPSKEKHNENIYCISKKGKMIWQIDRLDHVYDDSPYTGMSIKDGDLTIYNWDGLEVVIEPETGRIMNKKYGR